MIKKILEFLIGVLNKWNSRESLRNLGAIRSPQWSKIRNKFLAEHPECAVCGKKGTKMIANQIHHLVLFSVDPSKELDEKNLTTLCPRDHFSHGHLFSWRRSNKNCLEDCKIWNEKIKNRK